MDIFESWKTFEKSGKVEDYLKYAGEKRQKNAYDNFISMLEEDSDGRNNYSSGNGTLPNAYK